MEFQTTTPILELGNGDTSTALSLLKRDAPLDSELVNALYAALLALFPSPTLTETMRSVLRAIPQQVQNYKVFTPTADEIIALRALKDNKSWFQNEPGQCRCKDPNCLAYQVTLHQTGKPESILTLRDGMGTYAPIRKLLEIACAQAVETTSSPSL